MADRSVTMKYKAEVSDFIAKQKAMQSETRSLVGGLRDVSRESIAARQAELGAASAAREAASAQDKAAHAARQAARAQAEAAAANEDAAEAARKVERGELRAAEAERLAARSAAADRKAQLELAAAEELAAKAAEKAEKASIKAGLAQLAQGKAAKAAAKSDGKGLLSGVLGDGKQFAEDFAGIFGNSVRSAVKAVSALPPEIAIPVTIGAVTIGGLAFAELGSAAGAAVLTGIGAAGIGVAIAAQIKDPRVKAALNELSKDAKHTLKSSTQDFVTPIVRASSILDTTLLHIRPELRATFRTLAPDLLTLTRGASELVENVMPGLLHGAEEFEPIANALGHDLPAAGAAISEFFDDVSSNSQGAAEGLNVLVQLFIVGLGAIGNAVGGAEMALDTFFNTLSLFVAVASKIPGGAQAVAPLADALKVLTDTSGKAAGGVADFGHHAKSAATEADALNQSIGELNEEVTDFIEKSLSAQEAALDFKDALAGLAEAAKQNGTAIDDSTKAGRANEHTLDDLIAKANQARRSYIDQHSAQEGVAQATVEADRIFNQNINTLIEQAAKYGYSADKVRAYIAKILGIPASKATRLEIPGYKGALQQLQVYKQLLAGIKDKYITIHVAYRDTGGNLINHVEGMTGGGRQQADGGILDFRSYAAGGFFEPSHVAEIVPAGTYRLMAEPETGGEAYIPLAPSKRARSLDIFGETARRLGVPMVSPAALGGGMPAVTLNPVFDVTVLMGTRDITELVDVRITQRDKAIGRGVRAGQGRLVGR